MNRFQDARGQALTGAALGASLDDPGNRDALQEDRIRHYLTRDAWALLMEKRNTFLGPVGGRFDFVLYYNGEPRLAIEVDGGCHREYQNADADADLPPEEDSVLHHHVNDLLKDWIVERMMGWPVLRGNRRAELDKLDKLGNNPCAMLRLPDDGSTFGETNAFSTQLTEDRAFSLEELLERLIGEAPAQAAPAPAQTVPAAQAAPALEKIWTRDVPRLPFAPGPVLRRALHPNARTMRVGQMASYLSKACDIHTHRALNALTLLDYLQDGGYIAAERPYTPSASGRAIGLGFDP